MQIRPALEADLDAIMLLIRSCIADMLARGIRQWGDFYPTREVFAGDMERGTLHMAEEDCAPLGVIVFDEEQPPEYRSVAWPTSNGRIMVIHRLAVDPACQGRGVARALMDFAEEYARKNTYTAVRLDAYSGNPRALALYERRGYERTGVIFFPHRPLPFFCYEKSL